jgi:lysophospholipase L1-like esterase
MRSLFRCLSDRLNARHQPSGLRRLMLAGSALALAVAVALPAPSWAERTNRGDEKTWVGTWTASPQAPEPPFVSATPAQFDNQTVRQIIRTSVGGSTVRVRFSNEFGTTPLVIGAARVALQASGADIVPSTDRLLTFGGRTTVTIPAGAPALSDPVALDVPALANLVVSLHLPQPTVARSFHSLGRQTTYISPPGDYTAAPVLPVAATTQSWFFLSGITVKAPKRSAAIVTLGDSITDGFASTVDANRRWPNLLAERLQARAQYRHLAVLNHGISGNRTTFDLIGPNALARFDRDVLTAPGARFVIVLEGINNIGIPGAFGLSQQVVTADDIIASYQQLIERARERGLKIFGGTLTPFEGTIFPGYFTPEGEAKRQAVNLWIRTSGSFDGVIDFDKAIRDPARPARMLPAYDSGDHLHPNDAGYQAMANAIDLALFLGSDE